MLRMRLTKVCERKRVRFKIQERGGISLGNLLQNSNPTASDNCSKSDCFMDAQPEGGKNCPSSSFKVKVLKSFKEPLSRQIYEGVYIRRQESASLNTKLDYYQASTYRMNREVNHG